MVTSGKVNVANKPVSGHFLVSLAVLFPYWNHYRIFEDFEVQARGGARWVLGLPNSLFELDLVYVLFTLKMFSLIRNSVPRAATRVGIPPYRRRRALTGFSAPFCKHDASYSGILHICSAQRRCFQGHPCWPSWPRTRGEDDKVG